MSTEERRVFDPGLQPERTALAWRRTSMSVLVGSVAGARLLAPQLGAWAVAAGVAGAAFGVWMWLAAARRSRRVGAELLSGGHLGAGPGAGVLAVTAAACALIGCAGVWLVLHAGVVS